MEEKDKKEEIKKENNSDIDEKILKAGFFKKVWYSITKIEKYPNMSAQGFGKAVSYLAKIVAILAIIVSLGMVYQTYNMLKEGVEYLENGFPEFSYKDGILDVYSEGAITISSEDSYVGETIIDTKTEDEAIINEYVNKVTNAGGGVVILKDEVKIKNPSVAGVISYSYKETIDTLGITEFNKQDAINYIQSGQMLSLYVSVFLTIFIYAFMMFLLDGFVSTLFLSFFGYFTAWLARIKMRYVAIFNMAVYSLTLSIILNMIYLGINIFIPFEMEYFQVMYVTVAAIYLVAAIFILKSEFVKKQMELMKIAEAQEIIKKQMEEQEKKKEEEKRREEREKEKKKEQEKKKEENEKNDDGKEPEGSGA